MTLFGMILLIPVLIFILWIAAIVDIARATFKQPNNQLVFLILVIMLPILGSLIYFMIRNDYKL